MDNINFDLQKPFKVQVQIDGKNELIDLETIYLKAPSYKQKDLTIVLKKKFIEAIFALTNSMSRDEAQKTVGEEKDLDAKSIKAIIFGAKDFDIVSFFQKFENLLISEIAYKDEAMTQKLTGMDVKKIDENDFEELLAKYLEVFFITSWMKTLS